MGDQDWYRSSEWNDEIAARFEAKLRRARRKEQYLRIQASVLSRRCPEIALALLDRYFDLPDQHDQAQAHVDRAAAYLSLHRVDDAVLAFEAALARESEFPRLLTQACVDLPFLIAEKQLTTRYDRAMTLLDQFKARLMFPVDWFKWHAAKALIYSERNESTPAKFHAGEALSAAVRAESGFAHHQKVGLVGPKFEEVKRRMEKCRDA